MRNDDIPNRASNMEKAEGDRVEDTKGTRNTEDDRWTSDPDTIERQDREQLENGAEPGESRRDMR
jgi:hypothetical protein